MITSPNDGNDEPNHHEPNHIQIGMAMDAPNTWRGYTPRTCDNTSWFHSFVLNEKPRAKNQPLGNANRSADADRTH